MGFLSSSLLFAFVLHTSLSDQLIMEVTGCSTVTVTCINELYSYTNWKVKSADGSPIYVIALTSNNPIGKQYTKNYRSSSLVVQVIANDSTYFVAILTINGNILNEEIMVTCNELDKVLSNTYLNSTIADSLPSELTLNLYLDNIYITWNSTWKSYYDIIVSSKSGNSLRNETTVESFAELDISNQTQIVAVSVCTWTSSVFSIGPCFNDVASCDFNNKSFTLYLNGTWLIMCNSTYVQTNECLDDGNWKLDFCKNNGNHSYQKNMTKISLFNLSTSTIMEHTSTNTILILIIVILGIIAITAVVILMIILSAKIWRHKQRKFTHASSFQAQPTADVCQSTIYEHLSNNHVIRNKTQDRTTAEHVECDESPDGVYSSLHHSKSSICNNDVYATIQSTSSSKARIVNNHIEYAAINTCNHCGHVKPFMDYKVKYANICSTRSEADELLDLNTLLIQLRPISDRFKLFGSVAGISPVIVNEIISRTKSSYDGLLEVCDQWLKMQEKEKCPLTWHAVAEILTLIGETDLSNNILQVYVTGELPIPVDLKSSSSKPDEHSQVQHPMPLIVEQQRSSKEKGTIQYGSEEENMSDEEVPPPIPPYAPPPQQQNIESATFGQS